MGRSLVRFVIAAAVATCLSGLLVQGAAAGPETIKVRLGGDSTATRIVVDLDRAVQGKIVSGGDGAKTLTLDLTKLAGLKSLEGGGRGLVEAWSLEPTVTGARLKLTFNKGAVIEKRFLLAPSEGVAGYRYVIDVRADGAPAPARAAATVVAARTPAPVLRTVSTARTEAARPEPSSKKVIVIDAGHGGHDPGASGGSSKEKDVTLAMAKAVKERLEKTGRYRVVMTRDKDVYVSLENRVRISRAADADLFLSLHADAGANKETRGASVYTLSDNGSTRAERGQSGGGFLNIALPGGTKAVRSILFDLTQRATRNKSATFADTLISEVERHAVILPRAHRDAGFMVLLAPDVPSVLFEMGFMTNSQDEALLTSSGHRAKISSGIVDAIDTYFAQEVRIAAM